MDSEYTMEALAAGSVGVMPTDTVYGLVCSATDERAVSRLYDLKDRRAKPGTLTAANIEQLVELGIPRRYLVAVEHFWPGPVSVVIPLGVRLSYLHQGKGSLALRIPSDVTFTRLLEQTGPLLTTSANLPGEPTATTIEEDRKYFGDRVDFYIDGGDISGRKSSTIIRVVDDAIEVIRQGAVSISESGDVGAA